MAQEGVAIKACSILSEAQSLAVAQPDRPSGYDWLRPEAVPMFEMPAMVLAKPEGRSLCFISSGTTWTAEIKEGKSLISDNDALDLDTLQPATWFEFSDYWNYAYNGIYSPQSVWDPASEQEWIYAIMHVENKNRHNAETGERFENTILARRQYRFPEEYEGLVNGRYIFPFWTYFGFVTASVSPVEQRFRTGFMQNQLGPVIWPSMGYLDPSGRALQHAHPHPTTIVHDGYLYVYYIEDAYTDPAMCMLEPGRERGVKVARCPLSKLMKPGFFRTYYMGKFSEPSLPTRFSKENRRFLFEKGGRSSVIHPDLSCDHVRHDETGESGFSSRIVRFSVARLRGTRYFLSVEQRWEEGNVGGIALRVSTDLLNWSTKTRVPGVDGWKLRYPVFANSDYTRNYEIDAHEFYVAGGGFSTTSIVKLAVEISESQKQRIPGPT